MLDFHILFVFAVIAIIISVTVGEDLQHLLARISDLFHPTDRALRAAHQRTKNRW